MSLLIFRALWRLTLSGLFRSSSLFSPQRDLNKLILDYLLIEGYKSAAQSFAKETSLKPAIDLESIENRMVIRNAVQRGDIETAVGWVNELNPEQRLIELIRTGDLLAALKFASEELAPRGEEFPEFLPELEKTMALLAFDLNPSDSNADSSLKPPSDISALLSSEQRFRIAGELNAAILESQNQNQSSKLPKLLRILDQGEELLSHGGVKDDLVGPSSTRNPGNSSSIPNTGGIDFPRLDLASQSLQEGRRMRGPVNVLSNEEDVMMTN